MKQAKEQCHDRRGVRLIDELKQDLRLGARQLRRKPGLTAIAILTLALGIGANTAIFSAINTILLQPLPYKDSSRLVRIWFRNSSFPMLHRDGYSPQIAAYIRAHINTINHAAIYSVVPQTWNASGRPAVFATARVSAGFFRLLGERPALGRLFSPDDFRYGSEYNAVLSYRFWQRRFGASAEVLGQTVFSAGRAYSIIGVARRGFHFPHYRFSGFPEKTDIWIPLGEPAPKDINAVVIARLRRGSNLRLLQAQLAAISAPLARREFTGTYVHPAGWSLRPTALKKDTVGHARPVLLILFAASALVWLLAMINIAGLQIAHGHERARETGIRLALGATRRRMVRQWLVESCLLAFAGGIAGLFLAIWGAAILRALAPASLPRISQLHLDWMMVAFALAISVSTGLLTGILPALWMSRLDPNAVLHGAVNQSEVARSRRSVFRIIAIGETALVLVLLVCSGLLTHSLDRLLHIHLGLRTRHLLAFDAQLNASRYKIPKSRAAFFANALRRIATVPGVESAALSSAPLLAGVTFVEPVMRAGSTEIRGFEHLDVSPGYFRTLGIPLLRGRDFTPNDIQNKPYVAIVNQALARRLWGVKNPVGRFIHIMKQHMRMRVVAVVADARDNRLRSSIGPELYTPMQQFLPLSATILARAGGSTSALGRDLRDSVWSLDPNLLLSRPRTADSMLAAKRAGPRFVTGLTDTFTLLGLALGLVGVYGVFSFSVERRKREFGLRIAIGAKPWDIRRLVLAEGLRVAGSGILIGLPGALIAAQLLRGQLYGVSPSNPAIYAYMAVLLVAVSLIACSIPAQRAARFDPMSVLRYE